MVAICRIKRNKCCFLLQVTLNNYTFENVAFHVLHQRFPLYSCRTLSDWFDHNTDLYRFVLDTS